MLQDLAFTKLLNKSELTVVGKKQSKWNVMKMLMCMVLTQFFL